MPEFPPKQAAPSVEDVLRAVDRIFEQEEKRKLPPYLLDVIHRIRFKLVGCTVEGEEDLSKADRDFADVQHIERQLLLDPEEVRKEFQDIRKNAQTQAERDSMSEHMKISQEGYQAFVVARSTLERVRYQLGWILQAGLEDDNERFWTLGTNMGLFRMPTDAQRGDREFEYLDASTLAIPPREFALRYNPDGIAVNWRTSVLPSITTVPFRQTLPLLPDDLQNIPLRRLGIGSALKYLQTRLTLARKKTWATFNIGTIDDWQSTGPDNRLTVRNAVSYQHNREAWGEENLEPLGGYRTLRTALVKEGPRGAREFIASIGWYARIVGIQKAWENLRAAGSVLRSRLYDVDMLDETADRMDAQLRREEKVGRAAS